MLLRCGFRHSILDWRQTDFRNRKKRFFVSPKKKIVAVIVWCIKHVRKQLHSVGFTIYNRFAAMKSNRKFKMNAGFFCCWSDIMSNGQMQNGKKANEENANETNSRPPFWLNKIQSKIGFEHNRTRVKQMYFFSVCFFFRSSLVFCFGRSFLVRRNSL